MPPGGGGDRLAKRADVVNASEQADEVVGHTRGVGGGWGWEAAKTAHALPKQQVAHGKGGGGGGGGEGGAGIATGTYNGG